MQIGEVATQLGMAASTIRYYERIGLIKPQHRVSGQRRFDEKSILMLKFVKLAKKVGFTLTEIQSLSTSYAQGSDSPGICLPYVEEKKLSIRQQIFDLQKIENILNLLSSCQCSTLAECVAYTDEHYPSIDYPSIDLPNIESDYDSDD